MSANEKNVSGIQSKIFNAVEKFSRLKFVKCMQKGVVACMNATMIGSIFMLLMIPPFPADSTFGLAVAWRAFSAANAGWLNLGYQLGLNAASLYILFGMVIATCEEEHEKIVNNLVLAVFAFLCMECSFMEGGGLNIGFWGAKGMMSAMVIGFVVPEANIWLLRHGIKIKMPESVPPFVAEPLNALFSSFIVAAGVFAVKLGLGHFGFTLGTLINAVFAPIFSASDSLIAVLVYCIVVRILWFFGLHGNSIAGAVVNVVLSQNLVANAEAIVAGGSAKYIFNSAFQNWTTMGILFMVISMLLFAKSKQLKAISRISLVPALFNIGEPLTFGLPIMLNFDILGGYLLNFALCGAIPYLACKFGFMNIPYIGVPFTIPAVIKVFLMSMDFRAILVYIVDLVICVAVMTPSIIKYDRKLLAQEKAEAEAEA